MALKTQSPKSHSTAILHNRDNLPGPASYYWEWQMEGSCRDEDSTVFFHPEGERGHARVARERRAKAVCAECPVVQQCREHALAVAEPYGIWGGLSEAEREAILNPTSRAHRALSKQKNPVGFPSHRRKPTGPRPHNKRPRH